MAIWRVSFAVTTTPRAHALRVMSHFCYGNFDLYWTDIENKRLRYLQEASI